MLNEVILNLYAQDGISRQRITKYFEILDENEKIKFLDKLLFLTQSSNAHEKQLEEALENSGYRNTINYYNMLKSKKNIFRNNLFRLKELDGKPFEQGFDLLLELFKEAYKCKALKCREHEEKCKHWWHYNLSDESVLKEILVNDFGKYSIQTEKIIKVIREILIKN